MRNLALALFRHERIITTVPKAKEARRFVEKLITLAKKGTLQARRLVIARLGSCAKAEMNPEGKTEEDHLAIIVKLFDEIGPRFHDRPGGYTRVIKRHERRLGDGGQTAFLELLKGGETKVRRRQPAPAPAPRVREPQAPRPEPAAPPTPTLEEPRAPAQESAAAPQATPPPGESPQSPGATPPAPEQPPST
jgi:large subunit ribosomal protein L17